MPPKKTQVVAQSDIMSQLTDSVGRLATDTAQPKAGAANFSTPTKPAPSKVSPTKEPPPAPKKKKVNRKKKLEEEWERAETVIHKIAVELMEIADKNGYTAQASVLNFTKDHYTFNVYKK